LVETVVWQPAKARRSRRRPQLLAENRDGRFLGSKRSHRFVSSAIALLDGAEEFVTADGSDVIVVSDCPSIGESELGVQQNLGPRRLLGTVEILAWSALLSKLALGQDARREQILAGSVTDEQRGPSAPTLHLRDGF